MPNVIVPTSAPLTDLAEATPAWLTETLRAAGVLPHGHVDAIEAEGTEAFNSVSAHLRPSYADLDPDDSPPPAALFLKLGSGEAGANEILFYRWATVRPASELPMLVRCYALAWDPETGHSHLLLEGLSATHEPPVERAQALALDGVPSDARLRRIIDALARFHAAWWEHPKLAEPTLRRPSFMVSEADFKRAASARAKDWARLREDAEAKLPKRVVALYDDLTAGLEGLWPRHLAARFAAPANRTLIHGDAYLGQWLLPREGGAAARDEEAPVPRQARLIDFDACSDSLGADDLVFLMATFWTREQRTEEDRERLLLRRYLAGLQLWGVDPARYGWNELTADYRAMLAWRTCHPLWDYANGSARAYWWPKMSCLTAAYEDWDCASLLG